jgi:GntR family transcriptional regulator / MocR family aminotransferase
VDIHVRLEGRDDLSGQVYRQVREAIVDGRLRPGQSLPPTREFARSLEVSRNTVSIAYERLTGEGFLRTRVGAGTYVCEHRYTTAAGRPRRRRPEQGLQPHTRWDMAHPRWDAVGRRLPPPALTYDFAVGLPDLSLFPFDTWRRMVSRELRTTSIESAAYGDAAGHPGLRTAIARHIGAARGVITDPDLVTVTNGAQQAFDLAARALLQPGDCVAVEEPGYPPPRMLMRSLGMRVVPVRVDAQGLVVAELPGDARLVYVTPAHQFPLGMPMSLARRRELLAWAAEHDAAVIEDDYDSEFRFAGRSPETLYSLDGHGRVLYVSTFSKTMLPAIRLGYLVAPPSVTPALRLAKYVADWTSPLISQAALARFIDEGLFARHIRKMRGEYSSRHELIMTILAQQEDWVRPIKTAAGIHLTALLPAGRQLSDQDVRRLTDDTGVTVNSLWQFYDGKPAQSGLVIGYGAIAVPHIAEGLKRLRYVLEGA